jgi:solute carrier family 25 phosphate transporter 3
MQYHGYKIPYTFGKQVSFDIVAKYLYRMLNSPTADSAATLSELLSKSLSPDFVKWTVSVLSAMVASVMACFLSHPGDVILTETHKGGGHGGTTDKQPSKKSKETTSSASKQSLCEVSATIYSRNGEKGVMQGLSGFFTGLQARFVHVGLIITSQLVIYDIVKQLLGLPATGSH